MLKCNSVGKTIRIRRLFNSRTEKSIVVAVDHGKTLGAVSGLEKMEQTLELLLQEGPDAVLLNPGMFRLMHHLWKGEKVPGIIIACDTSVRSSIPGAEQMGFEYRLLSTAEEAVSLGADAIKVFLIFCRKDLGGYGDNLKALAQVIRAADRFGLPVMVEATLWGAARSEKKPQDTNLVADICRVATEMGADLLKVPFIGAPEEFRRVTDITPIPVTILGGAKTGKIKDVFVMVEQALQANVSGLVFGRNIWQHPTPRLVLRALKKMVHQGVSTGEIFKEFSIK